MSEFDIAKGGLQIFATVINNLTFKRLFGHFLNMHRLTTKDARVVLDRFRRLMSKSLKEKESSLRDFGSLQRLKVFFSRLMHSVCDLMKTSMPVLSSGTQADITYDHNYRLKEAMSSYMQSDKLNVHLQLW